jgi:hypothetical protein
MRRWGGRGRVKKGVERVSASRTGCIGNGRTSEQQPARETAGAAVKGSERREREESKARGERSERRWV